ncbi:hypothetical protein BD414DRAFT_515715 [Trametes punicea]|nr:hypothetical protein BD414DRAFT_515715 [Trametes punicea]
MSQVLPKSKSRPQRPSAMKTSRSSRMRLASLHLEGVRELGEWEIVTSTRAQRDLRKARKEDGKKFKIIVKKIQELSRGHFSDDNHKKLTGLNVGVPIYEAKMSRNLRLVYQIHCIPDQSIIRIFGVYTHDQLDRRFWEAISRTLNSQGSEYRKRCLYRERPAHRRGEDVVLPGQFPPRADEGGLVSCTDPMDLSKKEMEEELMRKIAGILANQDVAYVFNLSQREMEVIEHPSSCIVIGMIHRKTTTMLYKMLGIEHAWEESEAVTTKPRQLFITQSRVLAEKVEEYYRKLQRSFAIAKCTPGELKQMAADDMPERRQRLVDADEEVYWRVDLPKRYGALQSTHFPMFLTYDHLCRLLESEFQHANAEIERQQGATRALRDVVQTGSRSAGILNEHGAIISYKTFLGTYWSHFPQDLKHKLDPDFVFNEFMGEFRLQTDEVHVSSDADSAGVIQGSEKALTSEGGFLDEETYCSMTRGPIIIPEHHREAIYQLYLLYRKKKRQLWHRDAADSLKSLRTHELVRALKEQGLPGLPIDFLYVDEAQDNLLVDTHVLRTLCPNPHGMFWAGDTAQTISAGSAFRFSELKAFLFRFGQAIPRSPASASSSLIPELFHLTVNYRSHSGIVNCASSIVELITRFWPKSVDPLPQERGMANGPKPIFFWDQAHGGYEQFLLEDSSGSTIEFGAHQCILVRDTAAKERLRSQVGKVGIILTISESKGLEFDDVLLWHLFEDSAADDRQWRIILDAVHDHKAPSFDEIRHNSICRELKFLYVAVTRARMNLWIVDPSRKARPMCQFWTSAGLVQEHVPGTPIPKLAVASDKIEWATSARDLFQKRQYSEAELAFDRAGLPRERRVARAYHLRDLAHLSSAVACTRSQVVSTDDSKPQSLRAFLRAAEAFSFSAHEATDDDDKKTYHRIAGQCYVRARRHREAADAFLLAGDFNGAAKHYRLAGMFDEAVDVIQSHQDHVEKSVSDSILAVARLEYLRQNKTERACALFSTEEEALEYMAGYGLEIPRATLLESRGRYAEAAQAQLKDGNSLEAIRLLMLDEGNADSVSEAAHLVVDGLWPCFAFTNVLFGPQKPQGVAHKLLELMRQLQDHLTEEHIRDEMAMFQAIARRDLATLHNLSSRISSASDLSTAAELLCLDHIFAEPLQLLSMPLSLIADRFGTFLRYSRILQRLACAADPSESLVLARLFSYLKCDEEYCLVHCDSSLVPHIDSQYRQRTNRSSKGWQGFLVPRWELDKTVTFVLREHLRLVVLEQNEICHELRSIQPCRRFATSGWCRLHDRCPQHHLVSRDGVATYNLFVRIHILQIMIYHTLYASNLPSSELWEQQRAWLRRLYEALYPPHYNLGAIHLLSSACIPEFKEGQGIVTVWVQDFLNSLRPGYGKRLHIPFLSNLWRVTRLAMLFDNVAASNGLDRIPCMKPIKPMNALWRGREYVVHDVVAVMRGNDQRALERGVLLLNHILHEKLCIDVGVLCDLMDYLCGSLIGAMRLRSSGKLHGITLPTSWIGRMVQDIDMLSRQMTPSSTQYGEHLGQLLHQVYTGVDAVALLVRESQTRRSFYASNRCRNLCLWGHNLRSSEVHVVRRDIMKSILALRDFRPAFNSTLARYVNAKSWEDLVRAAYASTAGSHLDQLVYLSHISEPAFSDEPLHVRRVRFKQPDDILRSLHIQHPFAVKSAGRPMRSPPVPRQEDDAASVRLSDVHNEATAEEDASSVTQIEVKDTSIATLSLSSREDQAATIIAQAFRQYWTRSQATRDPLQERRRRIYSQFREQAQRIVWSSTLARILYLGPLPHSYLGVECTRSQLVDAAARARERLKAVDHEELEEVQSTLDCLALLLEDASELQQELDPSANVYERCSTETIRTFIRKAHSFVCRVETERETNFQWREDVDLAMRIISESLPLASSGAVETATL